MCGGHKAYICIYEGQGGGILLFLIYMTLFATKSCMCEDRANRSMCGGPNFLCGGGRSTILPVDGRIPTFFFVDDRGLIVLRMSKVGGLPFPVWRVRDVMFRVCGN